MHIFLTKNQKSFTIKKPYDIIIRRKTKEVKNLNQILSVENTKKEKKKRSRSSGPIEIENILKFFSIALIIFGVFMIGSGSYSMYKGSQEGTSTSKPTISVATLTEGQVTLKIEHSKKLAKVTYKWNDEEETEVDCSGKKKVEQTIQIPTGNNTLSVYAEDVNGRISTYQKSYTVEGDISIEFEAEGKNIKITTEGKEQIAYITYRWDDEEETKVDVNDFQNETTVEIPKGQHTLTVIAVDINNKTETQEQEVKGVTKPKLEVTTDGSSNFIIKASDEEGLKRLELIRNQTEKYFLNLDGRTELEYNFPIKEGENKLEVIVYNESDVTETVKVKVTK